MGGDDLRGASDDVVAKPGYATKKFKNEDSFNSNSSKRKKVWFCFLKVACAFFLVTDSAYSLPDYIVRFA